MTLEEKQYLVNLTNDFVYLWQSLSEEDQLMLVDILNDGKMTEMLYLFNNLSLTKTIN